MPSWSLAQVWNESLDTVPQRELESRDYVWASELGGSYYDRYWKMKGRQPTTPPNLRTRRKFEAGNLIEWVILQVLNRAGVLNSTQEHFTDDSGALKVTGRRDFEAGGITHDADFSDLPETIQGISENVIAALQKKFSDGLDEVNIEVKSCAGTMFERYEQAPAIQHALQAYIQAKTSSRPTLLVYVSRDDLRIVEWKIMPESEKYEQLYQEDLKEMAEIIKHMEHYPEGSQYIDLYFIEPLLSWDGDKFSKNWKVEYSNYLTDYGYERPDEYSKPAKSMTLRLNNIVRKIRGGKELTKVNLKTLEECYAFYPEAKNIIHELAG